MEKPILISISSNEKPHQVINDLIDRFDGQLLMIRPFLYLLDSEQKPLWQVEMSAFSGKVRLSYLQSHQKGQGKAFMETLCELADKHQCPISLTMDSNFGTDLSKLRTFYGTFGFEPRGQSKASRELERKPVENIKSQLTNKPR
jgi:hypothetical protein